MGTQLDQYVNMELRLEEEGGGQGWIEGDTRIVGKERGGLYAVDRRECNFHATKRMEGEPGKNIKEMETEGRNK